MPHFSKNPLFKDLLLRVDAYADSKTRSIRDMKDEAQLHETVADTLGLVFERLANLEETVRYMAENAHQGYHDVPCGWWECKKNICNAAQQALPELVIKLSGKR